MAHSIGDTRVRFEPDQDYDFDDLCGDTYNPRVNADIPAAQLARELAQFQRDINQQGVWGVIGEVWNGHGWQEADSCWGIVGQDHYVTLEIEAATKDAAERIIESSLKV